MIRAALEICVAAIVGLIAIAILTPIVREINVAVFVIAAILIILIFLVPWRGS